MHAVLGRALRGAVAFALCATLVAAAVAHVRLRFTGNGAPLRWQDPDNISIVIQAEGSDDIGDGSHETALRNAIEAWNGASGSRARLVESFSGRGRRDWQANDIHLVVFDENNSSGFFSGASGVVALTPVTFFSDGRIVDADVLFNGRNFSFTTSGESGRFDVQDVATHELGHLLGLDHSGVCGATMYPYVDTRVILHRSLALDDHAGMRHMYPASSFATLSGRIVRAGTSSGVSGAHVWARDADGRVAGAILTADDGGFTIEGLDAGSYTVLVDALDQPVSSANLGGNQVIETDFAPRLLGGATVGTGQGANLGTFGVEAAVGVQLGRVSDDFPQRLVRGADTVHLVRGAGLVPGSALLASDPGLALTGVTWNGTSVAFTASTPAGAALGHVDLEVVTPDGERDFLVGGLEVTPPDPVVAAVSPSTGDPAGGTALTLTGAGFRPGARVVVGNRVYRDGDVGGCVVQDANTISLVTDATIAGAHDVVVIDPTGVEGRRNGAFTVVVTPELDAVFPAVGASAGGTTVTLSGTGFVEGMTVSIDGVGQAVILDSPTRMRVITGAGVPGGPYVLRVTSPEGPFAEAAFAYVAEPDPRITGVTPDEVDRAGGATVTVLGSGFDADTRVVFGADPRTGLGGRAAASIEVVTSSQLRVVTPSSGVGTTSLMVQDSATGQVATLEAGFTFTGQEDSDVDDGGGCAALPPRAAPPTWRQVVGGAGWVVVALLAALARAASVTARRGALA